jgi:tRNA (guanine-N7-)-methyltransferase
MKFARWKNPYIDLLSSKAESILPFHEKTLTPEERSLLETRCRAAERIFVELGSGSGGHLLELAARHPEALCIGFELRFKRIYRSAEKAAQAGINNLLFMRTDARRLAEFFAPNSIDRLIVNFPDPWAKRSWAKNRLLSPGFLATIVETLKVGGEFQYKTDAAAYFRETLSYLPNLPRFFTAELSFQLAPESDSFDHIHSEFEKLFRSQGLPIHFLRAQKTAA